MSLKADVQVRSPDGDGWFVDVQTPDGDVLEEGEAALDEDEALAEAVEWKQWYEGQGYAVEIVFDGNVWHPEG